MKFYIIPFCLALMACHSPAVPCVEATPDAGFPDMGGDSSVPFEDSGVPAGDFSLLVLTNPVIIPQEGDFEVVVQIVRGEGYDAPLLVDFWGLPDGVMVHPRENRASDPGGLTRLTLRSFEDSWTGETNLSVQAADAAGLRHTFLIRLVVTD